MKYASVSVKFPVELDTEIERFLDENGDLHQQERVH
ncbi:MAG: hypothetical protein J07HQW2_00031 [Haloquadratum walsbyi J07HQW2]|uniref:Uncharacterized protein n=1 Tax=Haloquadratum walsbyi J07HQW2 TaxID=1238425 RepID=U1NAH0_9EURY|nr:MAG: hypothetical protein J07HQW2_00031 [Haloquadratum walsbyi J07HQW2]